MESNRFLKQIEQKKDKWDLRKLSLQSISKNLNQSHQKGIVLIEPPSYHSQLPAFINRKVKNLKPYTNHFKRFNIQNQKIQQKMTQNGQGKKVVKASMQSEKVKVGKYNVLKQLGIQQQIKPTEIAHKMSEISVYDQFLQKTTALLSSNVIQELYKQSLKNSEKYKKDIYQRSQRQNNLQQSREKIAVPRQQRRSIGGTNLTKERQNYEDKSSTQRIKSMNQLPKPQDGILRSDKVCVIPSLMNSYNDDEMINKNLKCVQLLKMRKPIAQTVEFIKKQNDQKLNQCGSKKSVKLRESQENLDEPLKSPIGGKLDDLRKETVSTENLKSPAKDTVELKQSPTRNQKALFKLNIGIKIPHQPKGKKTPFIAKRSQKEVTTINVDKTKQKPSEPQIPLPSNITAYSYIVYEPSFSQNNSQKLYIENLASTSKVFSNNRVLASANCKNVVQIASLTKIMTFLLTLQICERLKVQASNEKVRIGKFQANINGTSADIKEGEIYTVQQLYYGLMLPSGNDASLALATWAGKKMLIHEIKQKQKQKIKKKSIPDSLAAKVFNDQQAIDLIFKGQHQKIVLKKKKCYDRFILQMNKKARFLGMTKTAYANSHGLSNNLNKSCAFDLCILCEYGMMKQKFRNVVSTLQYKSTILYQQLVLEGPQNLKASRSKFRAESCDDIQHENQHSDEESTQSFQERQQQVETPIQSQRQNKFQIAQTNHTQVKQAEITDRPVVLCERQIFWQNTHQLLSRQEYIGIKTGITNTAGPCLASCIKTKENRCFIIIVLGSKKINYRFKDTQALRKWVYKREKLIPLKPRKFQIQSSMTNFKDDPMEELNRVDQNNEEPKQRNKAQTER